MTILSDRWSSVSRHACFWLTTTNFYFSIFYRVAVFVRRPGSLTETSWNTYIAPFSRELWLAVPCAILVLTLGLSVTFRIGRHIGIEKTDGNFRYSLQDSFIYVFGCICQQGLYVMTSGIYILYRVFKTFKQVCIIIVLQAVSIQVEK